MSDGLSSRAVYFLRLSVLFVVFRLVFLTATGAALAFLGALPAPSVPFAFHRRPCSLHRPCMLVVHSLVSIPLPSAKFFSQMFLLRPLPSLPSLPRSPAFIIYHQTHCETIPWHSPNPFSSPPGRSQRAGIYVFALSTRLFAGQHICILRIVAFAVGEGL